MQLILTILLGLILIRVLLLLFLILWFVLFLASLIQQLGLLEDRNLVGGGRVGAVVRIGIIISATPHTLILLLLDFILGP